MTSRWSQYAFIWHKYLSSRPRSMMNLQIGFWVPVSHQNSPLCLANCDFESAYDLQTISGMLVDTPVMIFMRYIARSIINEIKLNFWESFCFKKLNNYFNLNMNWKILFFRGKSFNQPCILSSLTPLWRHRRYWASSSSFEVYIAQWFDLCSDNHTAKKLLRRTSYDQIQ